MRLAARIGLAVLVVTSMGVVVSSSGFTATEADRNVTVTIVEDEDAYVGLSYAEELTVGATDADLELNTNLTEFTATYENASLVRNQFVVDVDVTLEVIEREESTPEIRFVLNEGESSSGVEERTSENEAHVPVGESAVFDAEITCELDSDGSVSQQSGNATVEYSVDGTGVSAAIERDVTVTCDGKSTL